MIVLLRLHSRRAGLWRNLFLREARPRCLSSARRPAPATRIRWGKCGLRTSTLVPGRGERVPASRATNVVQPSPLPADAARPRRRDPAAETTAWAGPAARPARHLIEGDDRAPQNAAVHDTAHLLLRWANGDGAAMAQLVTDDAGWIERHVRARLGDHLRQRVDTQDIVQNTLLAVLRHGPRFVCSDRAHLRALLARMVENTIRAEAHHQTAARRDRRREVRPDPGASRSVLILDQLAATVTDPGSAASRAETRDWLRLAL